MKLLKSLQRHLLIFYLLGQGAMVHQNHTLKPMQNCCHKSYVEYIPSAVYLLITIFITIIAIFTHHSYSLYYERTATRVTYLIILGSILINCTVIFQVIFFRSKTVILLEKCEAIVHYFRAKQKIKVSFEAFKRTYVLKTCTIFIFYLLTVLIKVNVGSRKISRSVQLCTLFMSFFKNLTNIHVLWYIELLNTLLGIMNGQVSFADVDLDDGYIVSNDYKFVDNLRHCKYIHFKLFEILQLMNAHFGWIMVTICLVNFIDASYAAFWIFIYLQEAFRTHVFYAIRK